MSSYIRKNTPGDTKWFAHDRFGMFIHFGLYSASARHEWIKSKEMISEEKYDKYFKYFNPDLFDAAEWARQAKKAGMKYAVLTAKHHEGFCLFDSNYTDYKITNTPFGRDLVKEFVEAFRKEGLRVGFYYSLIDWHHEEFTIDKIHPRRREENAQEISAKRDMKKYALYMRNQVSELLSNYGKIDILWFDYSYPDGDARWMKGKGKNDWESEKLISLARSIQPDIIINNRSEIEQDLWTPEQFQPQEWLTDQDGNLVTWEACQTFSGSWGYYRDEMTWKTPQMLINLLIDSVSRGGNLIMNVGPTGRGCFDIRAENALNVFAEWMKYNSRSIYGCTMAEPDILEPAGCRLTQSEDGKRLYIHIQTYPFEAITLKNMAGRVDYAQFLHDGSEICYTENKKVENFGFEKISEEKGLLTLHIPALRPDITVPVIELFLKD